MKKVIIFVLFCMFIITGLACAKAKVKTQVNTASDFTLNDINGKEISLSALLSDKLVLMDFWASWCPPCRKEAPRVQEFYEKYKDKVAVIGINVNESENAVRSFMNEAGLTYIMAIDDGTVADRYSVVAIPTIILIGKDRKILYYGHSVREAAKILAAGLD